MYKHLAAQQLSNVIYVTYMAAEIIDLLLKHTRAIPAAKANAVGVSERAVLDYCLWTNAQIFRRHYRKQFPDTTDLTPEEPTFSQAIRQGVTYIKGEPLRHQMTRNTQTLLNLSMQQIN